jgi:hypothetical protein
MLYRSIVEKENKKVSKLIPHLETPMIITEKSKSKRLSLIKLH